MRNIGNHADRLALVQRPFQGDQGPRAALLGRLDAVLLAAAGATHGLQAELVRHQRVEFGAGRAREHRGERMPARIERRRDQVLAVP